MKSSFLFLTFAAFLISNGVLGSTPRVVVSVKPLHSLVAGVMDGVGEPQLLVKGIATPHTYVLRPSDAMTLQEAELIFWLGESLEKFLEKPLRTLAVHSEIVSLLEDEAIRLLELDGQVMHLHAEKEHQPSYDSHIWLDPINAVVMVSAVVRHLIRIDPRHSETYQTNGDKLQTRLHALHAQLQRELMSVADQPFIVFHPAYTYLNKRYNLKRAGVISFGPESRPGARSLLEIRELIGNSGIKCIFTEPQFDSRLVHTVAEGTQASIAELDPLGADLPSGPELYFMLMGNLSRSLRTCLLGLDLKATKER